MHDTKTSDFPPRGMSPVRVVQHGIQSFEKSIDEVLAGGSATLSKALRVGLLAETPPAVSQPIIEKLLASLSAGAQMRLAGIEAHRMMDAVAKTMNMRELGFGDYVYKEEAMMPAQGPVARTTAETVAA